MGQTRHRRRTARTRRRQTRRMRQRGGAYVVEDLITILKDVAEYGESKNMYDNMVKPCIHPDYPRYAKNTRRGQNAGERVQVHHYMVLISADQANVHNDDNKQRDLIFIDIIVEDNTFIMAYIVTLPEDDEFATPNKLLQLVEGDPPTIRTEPVLYAGMSAAKRAARRPVYDAILDALNNVYKQPEAEDGVREC